MTAPFTFRIVSVSTDAFLNVSVAARLPAPMLAVYVLLDVFEFNAPENVAVVTDGAGVGDGVGAGDGLGDSEGLGVGEEDGSGDGVLVGDGDGLGSGPGAPIAARAAAASTRP